MLMKYIVHSLPIVTFTGMVDCEALEESLTQLIVLEKDNFLARFHEKVQNECEKAWHD